tara:strand:+ start:723 stop:1094 length:372 start_codon:yes stop_codon:yes gene_type:complete
MREAELHAELKFGGFSNNDDNLNLSLDNEKKQYLSFKPLIDKYNRILSEAQQSFVSDLNGIQSELTSSREYILRLFQEKKDLTERISSLQIDLATQQKISEGNAKQYNDFVMSGDKSQVVIIK